MGIGKSGRQIAEENIQRFLDWVKERTDAGDWADYWNGEKLSRTDIAEECGFGKSVLRQNPAVKEKLEALEESLRTEMTSGLGQAEKTAEDAPNRVLDAKSDQAVAGRMAKAKAGAESRVKSLEEENAALRAEIATLRSNLKRFAAIEEHLVETGRMVRP